MTEPDSTVDVVVVGGGPTGENIAARAVRGGLTAALVETELFGGECSYWACMPSKALLRPVDVEAMARRLPGVPTGPLDAAAVLARRDAFVSHLSDEGQVSWADGAGITPVRGTGRLAGERTVEVTGADGSAGCCVPGTPSWSPPAPPRSCPTCPGCARPGRGPTAR